MSKLITILPTPKFCLTYECFLLKFDGGSKLYGFTYEESLEVYKEIYTALDTNQIQNSINFGELAIPYLTDKVKQMILKAIIFTTEYGPIKIVL